MKEFFLKFSLVPPHLAPAQTDLMSALIMLNFTAISFVLSNKAIAPE